MIRRPTLRRVSYAVASSLLAVMLLGPAGTSAATPDLNPLGYGAPATVSAGGTGAIALTISNDGATKSTVSQLFLLDIQVTNGTFLKAVPLQGFCTGDSCTLGQLKPKKTATVYVLFTAPATGVVTASGRFETTGPAGDGDNSHGDAWQVSGTATVSGDTLNVSGRFIDLGGDVVVANDQGINSDTNKHATKVIAPQTLIGVSVQDGEIVTQTCGTTGRPACADLFGETSSINVAQGGTFADGFQIVISFDGSEIPGGVNQNSLKIYHTYAGGSEVISQKCTFAPNSPTPKSMPCLTVEKIGPDLIATIWTTHNGFMRGLG